MGSHEKNVTLARLNQLVTLWSPDDGMNVVEISNYALLNVPGEPVRLPGICDAPLLGADRSISGPL
ncbi:MAG: hypothetical protein V7760_05740 [Marinobacter sp.]